MPFLKRTEKAGVVDTVHSSSDVYMWNHVIFFRSLVFVSYARYVLLVSK